MDFIMIELVRDLIIKTCDLSMNPAEIDKNTDLYAAGLTSFRSVQLMLALEQTFDIEFPDHLLNRKTFTNIHNICDAIRLLSGEKRELT
jgi:acyl carrier protein